MKKNIYLLSLVFLISNYSYAKNPKEMAWGLRNNGEPVNTFVTPIQSFQLKAVEGEDINLVPAQKGRKVKVAILDTGVDVEHPDLKDLITFDAQKCETLEKLNQCVQQAENSDLKKSDKEAAIAVCRNTFLVAAENVYPADCHGWSILNQGIKNTPNNIIGRPDFSDNNGHGTHIAGIIASVTRNIEIIPVQVSGIGPNQPIKPFSIDLSPNENTRGGFKTNDNFSERVARGIIYAMNSGAEVINFSLGWPENQNTDIIKEAIAEAQRRGIIIVAAAGNDSTTAIIRPCQFAGVICVAAHSPDGSIASFSNFGFGVDIAAPGVEIVSSIPLANRSIRLPGYTGHDLLSGTSQATPFVTGVVAELISRGIPKNEIYARLVLGSRPIKKALSVLVGPNGGSLVQVDVTSYQKNILAGLLDMRGALNVQQQPLILPADKEVQSINWDRQSRNLSFSFKLKNYWKNIRSQKVQIFITPNNRAKYTPEVSSLQSLQTLTTWSESEEKEFKVDLLISSRDPLALSRLPSELSYNVQVLIDGKPHRTFEIRADVLVGVNDSMRGDDILTYDLNGTVPRGMSLTLVSEINDKDQANRDYFMIGKDQKDKKSFNIALVRNQNGVYTIERTQNFKVDVDKKTEDLSLTSAKYKIRMDIDGDGISEYIYGIIEYTDKKRTIYGEYRNHFYIFDQDMNLKKYVVVDDPRAILPAVFYWMKINGQMRPAWVGQGQEVVDSWDVTNLWNVDGSVEDTAKRARTTSDLYFYYLDENFKLRQLKMSDPKERIVEVIQTDLEMIRQGIVSVLVAKNSGTQINQSYISEFSIGNIQNGKLLSLEKIKNYSGSQQYRNLIDTYAKKTMTLKSSVSEYQGLMWYGPDSGLRQRVTLIDVQQKRIIDKYLSSQKPVFDAAMLVKASFQSENRNGAFLITNSELEYHDFNNDKVVSTSLNRYSFIGDSTFIQLYFPITIVDNLNPDKKLPVLYNTELSGLSRGVRMVMPLYSENNQAVEMTTPARLRFKTERGCLPLETPVYLGESQGYALDYQCSNKILRFLLKF